MKEERENFEKKNTLMGNQLGEKEEIINEKEKEIRDFRAKNVHL